DQARVPTVAYTQDPTTFGTTEIAAQVAIVHGQARAAANQTFIVDCATKGGVVSDQGAVINGQSGVIIEDPASAEICQPVGDSQTGDGSDHIGADVEHATGGIAVHSQVSGTPAVDEQLIADEQFARG